MDAARRPTEDRAIPWQEKVLFLLVGLAFAIPVLCMAQKSVTADEPAHLAAGVSYLLTGRITLNPQHPPLAKELCAIGPLMLKWKTLDPEWIRAATDVPGSQLRIGDALLKHDDRALVFFFGRFPVVLMSAALAALVALWSRKLWGLNGAVISTSLYVLDPNFLAHAQVITTDVPMAFFATLCLYALREYLMAPTRGRTLPCGLTLGLALGTKFSAVLLLALIPGVLGCASLRFTRDSSPSGVPPKHRPTAFVVLPMFGVALVVLWVVYLCPPDPLFYWAGIREVYDDHRPDYRFYFASQLWDEGRRDYLLWALFLKTPLPTIVLVLVGLLVSLRSPRAPWADEVVMACWAASFLLVSSFATANIGVRYALPALPVLYICAGKVATLLTTRVRAAVVSALLGWGAVDATLITPDHLSYFNALAGGPARGPDWLDDSNVDWGQGLIQLRQWLERNPVGDYALWTFSPVKPRFYGVEGELIHEPDDVASMRNRVLIISAHRLARARAMLTEKYGQGPGNWLSRSKPRAIVGHSYYVFDAPAD
ncbi:MAG: phospholipid carrier-dependent glycosyltransferase [Myxococcota bacterium]